jgi:allantoicase
MIDLVSTAVGGRIVECNDEFFAEASNLLNPLPPVWKEGVYTDRGKWMDGWETRRRREPGHDWCVIALGLPGRIETVTVDTSFFTGNYAEEFSLEGCGVGVDAAAEEVEWGELIPKSPLRGDSPAEYEVVDGGRVTQVRLNIYPDGGVARLRVEGTPIPSMGQVCPDSELIDLAALLVGGEALDASDSYYSPPSNMLRPTEPAGMWDGWETKRRRGPGHDWATFRLGLAGMIEEVVVDTRYFKGNAPGWVSVHLAEDDERWAEALVRAPVDAHAVNRLSLGQAAHAALVRLDIHPDGGVARFRVMGRPDREAAGEKRIEYLNSLLNQPAAQFFAAACSSSKWMSSMSAYRPFAAVSDVMAAAERVFDDLAEDDWLEAFAGHPRIGERGDSMANREQAGAVESPEPVLEALKEVNLRYEERFGFTYLVFATGKTAEEMLSLAGERLENDRQTEVANAAGQQRLITETRLRRMLCQEGS